MIRALNRMQPTTLLLLRLVLGAAMLYHGWGKVDPKFLLRGHLGPSLEHFAGFVVHLGLPRPLAYISAFTEFIGGIFLLLGLLVRFFGLLVAINMAVAFIAVNLHQGYTGSEYTLALIAIALMLLSAGAGAFSLDRRFGIL